MPAPGLTDLARVFHRIGWLSFGGPAAQIALLHRELVETRDWLEERRFLDALSLCMLLPGPEAMQLATYAGWRLHGVRGGLIAGGLFVLPGAAVIAALALTYAALGTAPVAEALLRGVQATVIVIVAQALWRLTRKTLLGGAPLALAAFAFVGLYAAQIPYPALLALAAAVGAWLFRTPLADTVPAPVPRMATPTLVIGTALWLAPLAVLALIDAPFLLAIAGFFAKLAVLSFGGAYAALAYMAQDASWVTPAAMIDALGLAETTPGPLVLATQFVAMVAGHGAGGWPIALAAGLLTLWMMFLPSFLFIFALAPQIDRLRRLPALTGALTGVTAAVVGVILNLGVFFALHVLFARTRSATLGPLAIEVPVLSSLSPGALVLVAVAAALLLGRRTGILPALIATATLSGIMALI
ncbi:chromate efflux transporter [Roseivivax sp. CAU 1753]